MQVQVKPKRGCKKQIWFSEIITEVDTDMLLSLTLAALGRESLLCRCLGWSLLPLSERLYHSELFFLSAPPAWDGRPPGFMADLRWRWRSGGQVGRAAGGVGGGPKIGIESDPKEAEAFQSIVVLHLPSRGLFDGGVRVRVRARTPRLERRNASKRMWTSTDVARRSCAPAHRDLSTEKKYSLTKIHL